MKKITSCFNPLICLAAISLLLASACSDRGATHSNSVAAAIDSLIPQYSHSFRVDYYKGYRVVKVYNDKDKKSVSSYLLYHDSSAIPPYSDDIIKIKYPATRVACMSTTHIGAMELMNARNLIAAASNKDFIYDSLVRAMIASGQIKDAGKDYQPDYEAIAQTQPDLLFSDGENSGASQMYAKMKALGINIVACRDYYEQEPLARAEWIKFFAAFIGKEKLADSIFDIVKTNYLAEKAKSTNGPKPTVFCNLPYSGVWYMPCGENYTAKLISDAGGGFLWDKEKPLNGLNLTLNFEQVYRRAANADFWINVNTLATLAQIAATDAKFRLFKAFKTGRVYNCTHRISPNGSGLDIWETGAFRPDIVLADLCDIFHPSDTAVHQLYYYERLK
jgi:iron complex transport system substrate-binding protein